MPWLAGSLPVQHLDLACGGVQEGLGWRRTKIQLGPFSKARKFGGYAFKPAIQFDIFRPKAPPNLKSKASVLLSLDRFV